VPASATSACTPLRHTGAAVAIANGTHLKVISELWGHSSVAITGDGYGHVAPELAADAMAALGEAFG
jgi:integrase